MTSMITLIKISPTGKTITDEEMLSIFKKHGATRESIFRRYEMNEVIKFTEGVGVDIGCGLNKIHSAAIGVDKRLGPSDFGYPFGAQVRADGSQLPWIVDKSLDYVFSSHCLEHFPDPNFVLDEWSRVIKSKGRLVLLMPHKDRYPNVGTRGANPDHKRDYLPADVIQMLSERKFRIIQADTLYEKMKGNSWAQREAPKYGHPDLNFSFEVVAERA